MKKLFYVLIVLIVITTGYAQKQHIIDSFETVLSSTKQDTAKALVLAQLSKAYMDKSPGKALAYAQQCLALSEQLGYKKGIASGYFWSAYYYTGKKTAEDVIEMHFKALKIREEIGEKKGIASSCYSIGNIFMEQGNYSEALAYYFKGLKICENIKEKILTMNLLLNISNAYLLQGKYADALSYSKAGATVAEETGNLQCMAELYNNMGESHRHLGNYPEALKVYFAALSIYDREANNKSKSKASCLNNIGEVYNQLGIYPDAMKYNVAALAIAKEIKDETGMSVSYINLGSISIKTKKYSEASTYLRKGLTYASNLSNFNNIYRIELMKDSYNYLSKLDSATGNIASAYKNYKLYITYRDSLLYGENAKKSTQLLMQFEFDKKEAVSQTEQAKRDAVAEKELQKQKLVRNGFIGGFGVMLLFSGLFLFQRNKIKKGKKLSDNLLLNILPAEVAEELKTKGSASAKEFDNVTVLFTDFKSFTTVSEQLSPQELVDELHACFKVFDEIITKYNIEKIKTIGDAYLAVSGLPLADENHAENVVNAALEIREFMVNRSKELGEKTFEIRIGINSGSVVAGIVGVKKFAYDIWGDTVNTAARMEQNSEAGKINISETTYELVKDKFTCEFRGEIDAKNKGMLKMYFVE
ncbi:MAG: tetratricopeptide repeat protein [Bacteroidetes bacterium]|nr:tetratricopeptide repeat protein [Bacteroidota bacterium]